jgi:hypothetical protein
LLLIFFVCFNSTKMQWKRAVVFVMISRKVVIISLPLKQG